MRCAIAGILNAEVPSSLFVSREKRAIIPSRYGNGYRRHTQTTGPGTGSGDNYIIGDPVLDLIHLEYLGDDIQRLDPIPKACRPRRSVLAYHALDIKVCEVQVAQRHTPRDAIIMPQQDAGYSGETHAIHI